MLSGTLPASSESSAMKVLPALLPGSEIQKASDRHEPESPTLYHDIQYRSDRSPTIRNDEVQPWFIKFTVYSRHVTVKKNVSWQISKKHRLNSVILDIGLQGLNGVLAPCNLL